VSKGKGGKAKRRASRHQPEVQPARREAGTDAPRTGELPAQTRRARWLPGNGQGLAILAVIMLVGLGLRIAYLQEASAKPDYDLPLSDARYNDYWARALATGDWTPPAELADPHIPDTPYFRPPGYPYFLASLYTVLGDSYDVPRIVQMLLGLANIYLAFLLGRRLFGDTVGLVTAGLMATYWGLLYFEMELQPPVLVVTLTLGLLLFLTAWDRDPKLKWAIGAGLILGVFTVVRSNVLLFVPVLLVWMWWSTRKRLPRRQMGQSLGVIVGGVVLLVLPVTIRNATVGGEFVPISTNGGVNLYIGNNPDTSFVTPRIPDVTELSGSIGWSLFSYYELCKGVERVEGREMSAREVSGWFSSRAWDFIGDHPGTAMGYAVKRFLLLWGPTEVSNNKQLHFERSRSGLLRILPTFPMLLAGALGGVGVWLYDRRRGRGIGSVTTSVTSSVDTGRTTTPEATQDADAEAGAEAVSPATGAAGPREVPQHDTSYSSAGPGVQPSIPMLLLILLFVVVYSGSFAPFLTAGRFRLPLVPLLAIFASVALVRLVQWLRAKKMSHAGGLALGLAVLLFLTAGPVIPSIVPYEPDLSSWHLDRAAAYIAKDLYPASKTEFEAAIKANPRSPIAYSEYGDAHTRQAEAARANQRMDEAEAFIRKATELYEQALALNPNLMTARRNLALAYSQLGQPDKALEHYREAARLVPSDAEAQYNLGTLLMRQGDIAGGKQALERALAASPGYYEARINLGYALFQLGQREEAYRQVEQAARSQPNRVEAHLQLASLKGQAGDMAAARQHLETARRVAPNDPRVQRLQAQLRGGG
jgi:tetratricopeptide (TPR) repeat protein/4-amino-4-deoxy-L-arabinose transferase-like glycosyltransferase